MRKNFLGVIEKKILVELSKESQMWKDILSDVLEVEKYLGQEFRPITKEEKEHFEIVEKIHKAIDSGKNYQKYLNRLAILRKSLG